MEPALYCIAFIVTTWISALVFFRRKNSVTHQLFFILGILIDLYIVVNYISLHPLWFDQLFWIRCVMGVTSLIAPCVLFFVTAFPKTTYSFNRLKFYVVFAIMCLSVFLSVGPYVFTGLRYEGNMPIPVPGEGMFVFMVDFVGLFVLSFIIFFYKLRSSVGLQKTKQKIIFVGLLISFGSMAAFTVIAVVVFKVSSFVFLGPLFPTILMLAIAYLMLTYGLLNVSLSLHKSILKFGLFISSTIAVTTLSVISHVVTSSYFVMFCVTSVLFGAMFFVLRLAFVFVDTKLFFEELNPSVTVMSSLHKKKISPLLEKLRSRFIETCAASNVFYKKSFILRREHYTYWSLDAKTEIILN